MAGAVTLVRLRLQLKKKKLSLKLFEMYATFVISFSRKKIKYKLSKQVYKNCTDILLTVLKKILIFFNETGSAAGARSEGKFLEPEPAQKRTAPKPWILFHSYLIILPTLDQYKVLQLMY